ncbi:hypothetical protein SESBI_27038, partial [Sesbania bispinosa]
LHLLPSKTGMTDLASWLLHKFSEFRSWEDKGTFAGALLGITIWNIWKERNVAIFEN